VGFAYSSHIYPDEAGHEFHGGRDLFRAEIHRKISIGYHQIVVKIKMLETDFRMDRAHLLSCNRSVWSSPIPMYCLALGDGFFAPAKTPDAIALTLNAEINRTGVYNISTAKELCVSHGFGIFAIERGAAWSANPGGRLAPF
jgi:hypothetical protein